jgi:hypothetical protein
VRHDADRFVGRASGGAVTFALFRKYVHAAASMPYVLRPNGTALRYCSRICSLLCVASSLRASTPIRARLAGSVSVRSRVWRRTARVMGLAAADQNPGSSAATATSMTAGTSFSYGTTMRWALPMRARTVPSA